MGPALPLCNQEIFFPLMLRVRLGRRYGSTFWLKATKSPDPAAKNSFPVSLEITQSFFLSESLSEVLREENEHKEIRKEFILVQTKLTYSESGSIPCITLART